MVAQSVTEKAMLAKLNISQWSASKHDREITEQVAQQHGADSSMGRYSKRLLAKDALDAIKQVATQARHHHYENTLPWLDDGARILPAANYFDYITKQREYEHQFEAAVSDFVYIYPQLVKSAKASLNGLFKQEDYPSANQIGERFKFAVACDPMPDASDFRVDVGDTERALIQADIEARVNAAVEDAMTDLWKRVHDNVSRMAERLRGYHVDGEGKVHGAFRDSLVGNMRELVEVLPKLNFTGSNSLETMRQRLENELCQFEPKELRENETVREAIAENAEAILKEVSQFLA